MSDQDEARKDEILRDTRKVHAQHIREKLVGESGESDAVGGGIGGVAGAATGAAIGAIGGPLTAVIGGIAGAVGGWWAGQEIAQAASKYNEEEEARDRTYFESDATRPADRSYETVRPAYQLGYLASNNPDYAGKTFDEIEPDLQRGWSDDVRSTYGEWAGVRNYARDAYTRRREAASGTATTQPGERTIISAEGERRVEGTP